MMDQAQRQNDCSYMRILGIDRLLCLREERSFFQNVSFGGGEFAISGRFESLYQSQNTPFITQKNTSLPTCKLCLGYLWSIVT